MRSLSLLAAAVSLTLAAQVSFADVSSTFGSNPLTDAGNLIQGPDAGNVNSRFTYNAADTTLTAHYDSTAPTIKLLFPLGGHLNQDTSFTLSARFKIQSNGLTPSQFFAAQAPSFGLVNSVTTGSTRASTADGSFNIVTPGDAYDMLTFDYYPQQDAASSSITLSPVRSAVAGQSFNDRFIFDGSLFASGALPLDQFITLKIDYDAGTKHAAMDWGSGSLDGDLTGGVFDFDSFAITLWNDPQYAPTDGSFAWDAGQNVAADVVFDSFSVSAVPEPASAALLSIGAVLLLRRRGR
jgi:hypothetical protein